MAPASKTKRCKVSLWPLCASRFESHIVFADLRYALMCQRHIYLIYLMAVNQAEHVVLV